MRQTSGEILERHKNKFSKMKSVFKNFRRSRKIMVMMAGDYRLQVQN
jgi:hypothetical protein